MFLELGKGQLGRPRQWSVKIFKRIENTKKDVKFKSCGGLLLYAPQVC